MSAEFQQEPPEQKDTQLNPRDPVSSVYLSFRGLKRVSPHSLVSECHALGGVRTLGELHEALEDAKTRLEELGLFKSLQANVSLAQGGAVNVEFAAIERGRECAVGGNVDKQGEVSCDVRVVQPALLGGPLCATGSMGSTVSRAQEFLLRLSTPRFLGRRCSWNLDVARSSSDETQASGFSEVQTFGVMRLTDSTGMHALSVEASLRDVHPATGGLRLPSIEVQQAMLRSTKTSAKYSFASNLLHFANVAPGGAFGGEVPNFCVNGSLEAAGILGDVRFLRGEASVSTLLPLPRDLLWHVTGSVGLLHPAHAQRTCLQDRFFLGGASGLSSVLKGFANRGVGPVGLCHTRDPARPPKRCTDSLGGDAMVSAFTAISAPFAAGADFSGRMFAFCGAGALAEKSHEGANALLRDLKGGMRASMGLGLGLPLTGLGTLEITLSHPLWAQRHDVRQALQLGFRINVKG